MTNRVGRRLTITDAMIVVASLAVALGITRPLLQTSIADTPVWIIGVTTLYSTVICLTPTVLILQLRQPRPNLKRLCRQPGFTAILASLITMSMAALVFVIIAVLRQFKSGMVTASGRPALTPNPTWWEQILTYYDGFVGLGVIVAWVMLVISGRRRPIRHWLEHLGRVIGTLWIILFVCRSCVHLFRTIE